MKLKPKDFIFSVSLGIVLVFAFFLRFYHLGSRPLYGDETFHTVEIAASSPAKIMATNLGSILYPLLLHPFLPLGKSEIIARLPAALFGFLSVCMIYLLGKQLFGKKEGLIAAFLAACSIYMIRFSQTARAYTALVFFSLLSLYFLYRALHEAKISLWLAYALSSVLGIYFNFFFLVIIPVQVFFVSLLIFYGKILKKGAKNVSLTGKNISALVLSIFSILVFTFFFYLPSGVGPSVNLFSLLKVSFSNILRVESSLNPINVFSNTLQRQLTFRMWPLLFIIHIAFFAIGIVACIKNHKKALALLLIYLSLPVLLYVLSNPRLHFVVPPNYSSKFIFFLPLIYLLMAKGITALHSVSVRTISRLARIKSQSRLGQKVWFALVLALLLLEGVQLYAHNADEWNFLSLKRDREIDSFFEQQIDQREMIYFPDSPNKNTFLFIQPLHYTNSSKKGIMLFEADFDLYFVYNLFQNTGIWVVLNKTGVAEEDIARLEAAFQVSREKAPSRYHIIHISAAGQTLYEKIIPLVNFLSGLPGPETNKLEGRLLLAKIHLLAKKNREALQELQNYDLLKSQAQEQTKNSQRWAAVRKTVQRLAPPRRRNSSRAVQGLLLENIQQRLIENAGQCLVEGQPEVAISLYKMAESLDPKLAEKSYWYNFSLAESYFKSGMGDEAAKAYSRALLLTVLPKEKTYLLEKLMEIRNLPFGYFIWRSDGACHLRWWSDEKRTFSGKIACSAKIKEVLESHLTPDDKLRRSKTRLEFSGLTLGKGIKGFDMLMKNDARLSFQLRIDARKNISDKVILLPDLVHPKKMPFSLGQ